MLFFVISIAHLSIYLSLSVEKLTNITRYSLQGTDMFHCETQIEDKILRWKSVQL